MRPPDAAAAAAEQEGLQLRCMGVEFNLGIFGTMYIVLLTSYSHLISQYMYFEILIIDNFKYFV